MSGDPTALPTRRQFLRRMAGGIVVYFSLWDLVAAQEGIEKPKGARPEPRDLPRDFNAFIRIGEDGKVTGFTGKIEMGQGPSTVLAQMLADELDAPYDAVDLVMGDTDLCPYDQGTWGSNTVRFFGPALRAAGAEARGVLLQLASEKLGVPVERLQTRDGVISDRENPAARVTYGDLAKGKRIERTLKIIPPIKEFSRFSLMGKQVPRKDSRAKVTGQAKYSADIRLPGMLYARILRPAAHGATLRSLDTAQAEAIRGIRVLRVGDLVAVLHELPDVAEQALQAIRAEFDAKESALDGKTIFPHLLSKAPEGRIVASGGDVGAGQASSVRRFENTYLNAYVAHAAMETHAALADVRGGRATVWASTQNPFGARDEIADALGFDPEKVRVIVPFVGGAFGGKGMNAQAVEAARLSKEAGSPVQVMFSREEEFFYDAFRPAALVKVSSGIGADGRMTFWDYDEYYAGGRGSEQFYSVPNHRTRVRVTDLRGPPGAHPFLTGAWRGPGNSANTFARESQIDVMAAAAGLDPLEFRLRNLSDARMARVLRTAADAFGWRPAAAPSGRGYGLACAIDAGTYVATMAEVGVGADGAVSVKRVLCVQDMGVVMNPTGARLQMEGGTMMGLGYALSEEVSFQGGRVLDENFDTYKIPGFSWMPKIETLFVENNQLAPQGGGEPSVIVMGAVIANAVFDAVGARMLELPMTADRIKAARA